MKIGLNATSLNNRPSGAKQRFIGIYEELFKLLNESEFIIYEPLDCRVAKWFSEVPNVVGRETKIYSEGRVQKFINGIGYWKNEFKTEKYDIFEMFHLPLVKLPVNQTLLTIHDVRGLNTSYFPRIVYKKLLDNSMNKADHIITVSNAMKDEILQSYPTAKISVIYNGINLLDFKLVTQTEISNVQKNFNFSSEFILAVGHFEKRKNYINLLEAVAILRDRCNPITLVIIGNDSGELNSIKNRIHSLKLTSHVKILSGLSDSEVRCAYKLCSMLVFPSTYEGFGIPVLEAMAAGCPMALSDIPVFREITENNGVYFQNNEVEDIIFAIEKVLTSKTERNRQIKYGFERVQAFSFKNLGFQLANLYKKLDLA